MCKQASDNLRYLRELGFDDALFRRIRPDDEPVSVESQIRYCNPAPGRFKSHDKGDLNDTIRKYLFVLRNRMDELDSPTAADLENFVAEIERRRFSETMA